MYMQKEEVAHMISEAYHALQLKGNQSHPKQWLFSQLSSLLSPSTNLRKITCLVYLPDISNNSLYALKLFKAIPTQDVCELSGYTTEVTNDTPIRMIQFVLFFEFMPIKAQFLLSMFGGISQTLYVVDVWYDFQF